MAIKANNLSPDGFSTITKGVNSESASNILPPGQIAWLVNGQSRGGFLSQRPGFLRRPLSGDAITPGLFQGAALFTRRNMLVLSVGGDIYAIDLATYVVRKLTTLTTRNSSTRTRAWFCEAEDFMIVQDGSSAAFIFDGSLAFRADPVKFQVPTGTCMAYSQGRLWVTLPDQRSYVGSDIIYGSSGTAAYGARDAILYFVENTLIAGGGAFAIPFRGGNITAMVPLGQIDTSLGQGPLQVFCTGGAFSVSAPYLKSEWSEVTFPVQSSSLLGAGAVSDWSSVNVNGDVWYRSPQGIRSFQVARRDANTWTNNPLSSEVKRALARDTDQGLLTWSSGCLFNNRLLQTVGSYVDPDYGIIWRGLAVLDFDPIALITLQGEPPVWEGEWSGLRIFQTLADQFGTTERGFIIALGDGEVQLWELGRDERYDYDGAVERLIQWEIEGASYRWKDRGWGLKKLEWGDIWYDRIAEDLAFTLYYRPDQEPNWLAWYSWQSCATTQVCDATVSPITGCAPIPTTLATQYRVRQRFPTPYDTCDTIAQKPYRYGYEFQPRLVILGPCQIKKFRMMAGDVPEDAMGGCINYETCSQLTACLPDTLNHDSNTAPARG